MGQLCEIDMDGTTSSIGQARSFVAATLDAWGLGSLRDRAVLLTSELATNVVLHARTPFRLSVLLDGDLTVGITDGSDEMPRMETSPVDGERGRGLLLVSELATRWGTRAERGGKTVWFALALDRAPTAAG